MEGRTAEHKTGDACPLFATPPNLVSAIGRLSRSGCSTPSSSGTVRGGADQWAMVVTLNDLRGDDDGAGGGGRDDPSLYSGIQRARPTQSSARPGQPRGRPGTGSRSPNISLPSGRLSPANVKAAAFAVGLACLIYARRPANPFAEGAIPAAARSPDEHWDAILTWPTFTRHLTSYARAPPKASWWRGGKVSLTEQLQGVDYGGEDGHEPEALR